MRSNGAFAWSLVASFAALFACWGDSSAPESVAKRFWNAVATGDAEAANRMSVRRLDPDLLKHAADVPMSSTSFEDALQNDTTAVVPTTIVWSHEEEEQQLRVSFRTYLVRDGPEWKVEPRRTQEDLARAVIAATTKRISEELRDHIEELGRALEGSVGELRDALREALEDLEDEVDQDPLERGLLYERGSTSPGGASRAR